MKKILTGATFFIIGFIGVLFINIASIENPIGILINDESNLEAFLEKWNLLTLYNLSIVCIIIGVGLFLIEPIMYLYTKIRLKAK